MTTSQDAYVKLEGFGAEYTGKSRFGKVRRETKTLIIVEWGGGSKRFSKKSKREIRGDIWSGWKLA